MTSTSNPGPAMTERAVEAMAEAYYDWNVEPGMSVYWRDLTEQQREQTCIRQRCAAALVALGWRPPAQAATEREAELRQLVQDNVHAPAVVAMIRDLLALVDAARAERDAADLRARQNDYCAKALAARTTIEEERAAVAQARREARAAALEEAEKVAADELAKDTAAAADGQAAWIQMGQIGAASRILAAIRALAKEPPHE